MRKRFFITAVILCLVIYGQTFAQTEQKEPSCQGRTLSQWLVDLGPLRPGDGPELFRKAEAAEDAIRQMGPKVIPYLMKRLSSKEKIENKNPASEGCDEEIDEQTNEFEDQHRAASAFWALGKKADSAIPELSKRFLDKEKPVYEAGEALAGIGTPEVLTPLRRGLEHHNNWVRIRSASALGQMKHKAEPAIPDLIEMTRAQSKLERYEAVSALGDIPRRLNLTIPALKESLKDEEYVWRAAIASLSRLGPRAKSAIPELLEFYRKFPDVFSLWYAIYQIDPKTAEKLKGK